MAIGTSALFSGIAPGDLERMLPCLNAREKTYQRGQYLLHASLPAPMRVSYHYCKQFDACISQT